MHSFAHRHRRPGEALTAETHGRIMNLGRRYDLMTWFCDTFLLRGKLRELRQRTINLARIQPGDKVLDVGCGTGTLAVEVQQHVGATGQVFGIDPGAQQIARARSKAARRGLPTNFQVGVIEQLEFPDESFDAVLSTIMLHHLPADLKRRGLVEIARVLKSGGRLVIADFKGPHERRQPAPTGAGEAGIHALQALVGDAGFARVETDEMLLPHIPGLPSLFSQGVGIVRAYKSEGDSAIQGET